MGLVGPCREAGTTTSGFSPRNDRVFGNGGVVLKRRGRLRMTRGKFQRLQRIVPGGEGLMPRQLLVQTADYIVHLRMQLCVLQALLKLHDDT